MNKFYLTFTAFWTFWGFGMGGDAEDPYSGQLASNDQQIIRAIDSVELKGLNTLEAHNAEMWFV